MRSEPCSLLLLDASELFSLGPRAQCFPIPVAIQSKYELIESNVSIHTLVYRIPGFARSSERADASHRGQVLDDCMEW